MIHPISLRMEASKVTITNECLLPNETAEKTIELCIIDSGEHIGEVIGAIRYLADTDDDGMRWQVLRPSHDGLEWLHVSSCFKDLEQALNRVMALAYEYVSKQ